MAVGAARPAIPRRKPDGCCHQYRHRGGRARACGWLHATLRNCGKRDQYFVIYEKLSFNLSRDIVPVASLIRAPSVLEINPSVPARTVPEFIAYAKANPGKLTMASSGIGAPSHVFGELFKFMTGVNLVHVPYRGAAPAVADLVAGQVQVYFDPIPNSIGYI